ncbi:MAG: ABC transporter ATP-binding protein [Deltaproteobacteria bacterium]|nr:ABC transporter ATP-binding protein [Deltaproteobacteria bacterium]
MIEVQDLVRRYGDLVAVDGLNLSVRRGEVMGLLGPNGAGKTTTLRILCGCLGPSSGSVQIAGFDLATESRQARASLGYLPEQPPLYDDMSVAEFLDYAARLRAVARAERADAVERAMERTGLLEVRHRLIGQLSKGFRQRVGLAQALVHRPAVLVLDEPTSGLDPAQMASMRELIADLRGESTIVLSTHLLSEATSMCDRVTILAGGRRVATGTEEELRAQLLDGQRVRIEITGELAACSEALGKLEAVRSVDLGDRAITLTLTQGTPDTLAAVNSVAAAFGLVSSRPADGLEELFLRAVDPQ